MQVEGHRVAVSAAMAATGARVSNAYPTCPLPRDSLLKGRLTPDVPVMPHGVSGKGFTVRDGDASH